MKGPRKEKRSFAAERIKVTRVPFGDPGAPTLERRGQRGRRGGPARVRGVTGG